MKFRLSLVSTASGAFAASVVAILRRTAATEFRLQAGERQVDPSVTARYRPMLRLLEEEDLEFLRSHSGFQPNMIRRLRRQRATIFRSYLGSLTADFQCTCAALKSIMIRSGCDRPDLAARLLRAQIDFALGLIAVHCKLVLYRIGWARVDVTFLMTLFNGMQVELRSLVPQSLAAGA